MLQQNLFQSYYQKEQINNNKKNYASFSKILKHSFINLISISASKTLCLFVRLASLRGKKKALKKHENKRKTKT